MYTASGTHLVHEYAALGQPFVYGTPATALGQPPRLLAYNSKLGSELGLDEAEITSESGINVLTGNTDWPNYPAHASIYCGHQFGVFVPQLGDGRALLIAELRNGRQYNQLQLKGAGLTPFSRTADGRAVLRSSIREYVASEAMHALGIPTTRALSLTGTADPVFRETTETAAVVCRVSESFLRFGHFEYFSSTGKHEELAELLDWHIERHHPDLEVANSASLTRLNWLRWVIESTAKLMAQWQSVGFCHGVMNTDNMSVMGLTIDYGPYGFLDHFDIDHICNHSDYQGRYSYRNQPRIGHWNLYALAQALVPVLGLELEGLQAELDEFPALFQTHHNQIFAQKLGLPEQVDESIAQAFIEETLKAMQEFELDFTRFFRSIKALNPLEGLEANFSSWQKDSFFAWPLGREGAPEAAKKWLIEWTAFFATTDCQIDPASWQDRICKINAAMVPRNHLLQEVIQAAEQGNDEPLNALLNALSDPYKEKSEAEYFYAQPPAWARKIELSCSS